MRGVLLAILTLTGLPVAAAGQTPADSAAAPARCVRGQADEDATLVSAQVAATPTRLNATIDTVLRDLGYRVSTAETRLDQWVTLPRFAWPAGTEHENWHGADNPGVQVIVDVAPDSGGTRLSVAAAAVCLVGTLVESRRPGSVESMMETLSAVQVASEVTRRLQAQAKLTAPPGGASKTAGSPK